MITRIVRMTFQEDKIADFKAIFDASKKQIRSFEGCEYLALHRDHQQQHVYYTLSHWQSQENLDNYRNSALFRKTWARTKALFLEKPMAFSLDEIDELC